jgi:hypothetical protein
MLHTQLYIKLHFSVLPSFEIGVPVVVEDVKE